MREWAVGVIGVTQSTQTTAVVVRPSAVVLHRCGSNCKANDLAHQAAGAAQQGHRCGSWDSTSGAEAADIVAARFEQQRGLGPDDHHPVEAVGQ